MRSPDQKMESAYDLWAMAKIAEIIGEKADSEQYRQRSVSLFEETWKKEFMNVTPAFEVMRTTDSIREPVGNTDGRLHNTLIK